MTSSNELDEAKVNEEFSKKTVPRTWSFQLPNSSENDDSERQPMLSFEDGTSNDSSNDQSPTPVASPNKSPSNPTHQISEAERNLKNSGNVPFYKFVLTGGPCGGKTTGLARLFYFLKERGFEVITVPEAFTILAANGMSGDLFSTSGMDVVIQNTVMDVQITLEDGVERILRARGRPAVMMCDRGTMDGAAYMDRDQWLALLDSRGTNETEIRDNRYNAVFHMVTAADGAEDHYTLENNQARTEDAEMARAMDKKTQGAWVGHSTMYVFDNSTDFERKMERLIDVIAKLVGLPSNLKRRSAKFLLKERPKVSDFALGIDFHLFEVEKVYLTTTTTGGDVVDDSGVYSFIRKRTSIDEHGNKLGSVYQLTTVTRSAAGNTIEEKRIITAREYSAAYMTRDVQRHIVHQQRISFLYKLQSFTIHMYLLPTDNINILHAQVEASPDGGDPRVELPPFLKVEKRLSNTDQQDEEKYSAYSISIIDK